MKDDNEKIEEKKPISFSEAWKELKCSPKSLFSIFLLKFLESYSYFCIIYTLIIFLSEEYKYTDEQAGWSYGLFGMCTSVYGFTFGGYLIDNLGVRLSLFLGCCILFTGRCLLVLCTKHIHIILILYTVLPIGTCLGIPVMQIAIRRFTTENSRALAYSIFYAMMNVSAIFSASAIDFFRRYITDQTISIGFITFELTAYRALFLSGACTTVFSMFISFFCITEVQVNYENVNLEKYSEEDKLEEENLSLIGNNKENLEKNFKCKNCQIIGCCGKNLITEEKLGSQEGHFKNSNLNTIENDTTTYLVQSKDNINNLNSSTNLSNNYFKKNLNNNYVNGSFNDCDYSAVKKNSNNHICIEKNKMKIVPFETPKKLAGPCEVLGEVTSQKSFWKFVFMIVLLMGVRIVYRHLDATFPKYMIREFGKDVMYGSIIAINPFLIVILIPIFAPLSYQFSAYSQITFGALITSLSPFFLTIDTQMWSAIMFVVILSIGEALWSPRLYEYTIFITEEGREGIYMALASSPMFIATLITGATSGIFLESFCPEKGPKQSWKMWSIIGLITLTSPVLLFFLKNKIEVTEDELKKERIEKNKKKKEEEEERLRLIYENAKNLNYQNINSQNNFMIIPAFKPRLSNFQNLMIEEDRSFTIGNSIVRENEFTLTK